MLVKHPEGQTVSRAEFDVAVPQMSVRATRLPGR